MWHGQGEGWGVSFQRIEAGQRLKEKWYFFCNTQKHNLGLIGIRSLRNPKTKKMHFFFQVLFLNFKFGGSFFHSKILPFNFPISAMNSPSKSRKSRAMRATLVKRRRRNILGSKYVGYCEMGSLEMAENK